jgi:hypothetical protein
MPGIFELNDIELCSVNFVKKKEKIPLKFHLCQRGTNIDVLIKAAIKQILLFKGLSG